MATTDSQFFKLFEKTQWLAADVLRQHQQQGLEKMLKHSAAETDAYLERLKPVFRDGEIDMSAWSEVPFLTRTQAQLAPQTLYARNLPANTGGVTKNKTSGSTARALEHLRSDLLLWVSSALTVRGQSWFNTDFSRTIAILKHFASDDAANSTDGVFTPGEWAAGPMPGNMAKMGVIPGTTVQNDFLERIRPDYLVTYPSLAVGLVETLRGHQWPKSTKLIFCTGETLTQDQRDRVSNETGIRMVNGYGSSELGLLAFECPESGLMHLMSENAFIEIVRSDGKPAKPGDIGEVVVTSLTNFAMPFIRYKIGDFMEMADAPCPCGRSLPAVKQVLGRTRNLFRRPDGSLVWPNITSAILGRHLPNWQFQFVQKSRTAVELIYVPRRGGPEEDREAVIDYLRNRLFPELELTFVQVSEIPRGPSGKFEDCIREID